MTGHQIVKYSCGQHIESQCRCLGHDKPVVIGKRTCPHCWGECPQAVPSGDRGKPSPFEAELRALLNSTSQENGSDTPDFILAEYLTRCLATFNAAVGSRERWYGRR